MQAIMAFAMFAFFGFITFWKLHPVLFMFNGGISLILACYMAEIVSGGTTTNLSITYSLAMICYGFANVGFAFLMMFKSGDRISRGGA